MGRSRISRGHRDGPAGNSQASKIPQLTFVVQPDASVPTGGSLLVLPVVELQDQNGNPILAAGVLVSFGMGANDVTVATARTDSTGRASPISFVVDEGPGLYAMSARADNIPFAFSDPVTVTSANTAPVPVIQSPANGFTATVGVAVALNPTGTFDAQSGWVGSWAVLGPGGVVRFSHTGVLGDFGSNVTSWTPAIAESVTVQFTATDVEGLSATAQVSGTIGAAAPAPPGTHPNEPAGFTAGDVATFAGAANAVAGPEGDWALFSGSITLRDGNTYVPSGGAAAPGPAPDGAAIGEVRFTAGSNSGGSRGVYGLSNVLARGWRRIYGDNYYNISSNWSGHTSQANKVFIVNIHGSPCAVLETWGAGTGTLRWSWILQDLGTTGGTRNLVGTGSAAVVTRGLWQRVQWVLTANTPGVLNGKAELWVTNFDANNNQVSQPTKVVDVSDVHWCDATQTGTLNQFSFPRWEAIHGGSGGTLPNTQMQWSSGFYISGAN
jgi:hypothetical protein